MPTKQNRCWPGYEPVPGKKQHEQGSCRPKAESKTTKGEKKFRSKRRKQLDDWQVKHPHTRKSASQHLHAPGATPKTLQKKAAKKSSGSSGNGRANGHRSSTRRVGKQSSPTRSSARKSQAGIAKRPSRAK